MFQKATSNFKLNHHSCLISSSFALLLPHSRGRIGPPPLSDLRKYIPETKTDRICIRIDVCQLNYKLSCHVMRQGFSGPHKEGSGIICGSICPDIASLVYT